MATESSATTVWQGSLTKGSGNIHPKSGAFPDLEVTWASRTERSAGKTSPEELLAAAHASCFCMALSNGLAEGGNEPAQLEATATVSFDAGEVKVGSSHIVVRGRVPGIDQAQFEEAARGAGQACPVSKALSIDITVDATLDQ